MRTVSNAIVSDCINCFIKLDGQLLYEKIRIDWIGNELVRVLDGEIAQSFPFIQSSEKEKKKKIQIPY